MTDDWAAVYRVKACVLRSPALWPGADTRLLATAPVYVFAGAELPCVLDCWADGIDDAFALPHPAVLYDLAEEDRRSFLFVKWHEKEKSVSIHFAVSDGDTVGGSDFAVILNKDQTSVAAYPDAVENNKEHIRDAASRVRGLFLRAQYVLYRSPETAQRVVPPLRRRAAAKAGVVGWRYTVVTIDPAKLAPSSEPAGGTHASPVWHIRRGHWRRTKNGRTFVQAHEVGGKTRGGVVKDYKVEA